MSVAPTVPDLDIAVLLPCLNEAAAIAQVVDDFRTALPGARIYVFDNASTDDTAAVARAAGAIVAYEPRRGKGGVVRRMFADVDADIYVMADGDGTYAADRAPDLVRALIDAGADMVVAAREGVTEDAGRAGHAFGNALFNRLFRLLFGRDFTDIFSGYRAFSRRYVKSFPALSDAFEIETEMAVHASQLRMPVVEISAPYGKRMEGSASKLKTFRDGARILHTFSNLLKDTRPTVFYGALAGLGATVSLILAIPLVIEFLETGLVPRLPTAVLSTGIMLTAFIFAACGLILHSVMRQRLEQKRLRYLAYRPPPRLDADAEQNRNNAL